MSVPNIDASVNRGISTNTKKATSVDYKQVDDKKYIPKQFQEVAESMEGQFAEAMLKQMNQTVDETEGEDSGGMEYYKSLQTTERAKMMAQQNNLGLQNVILDQIYPKRMSHQNLPSYKLEKKTDTIEMGKNDSTSVPSEKTTTKHNSEGGLP